MGELHYKWNDESKELILSGALQSENVLDKFKRKQSKEEEIKIYVPHKNLFLRFKKTLHPDEQKIFTTKFVREISGDDDIIMLQDIKDLVLFLVKNPLSSEFIQFFHLPLVDRFLRVLIFYFDYFLMTWNELKEKRAAYAKKAPNPLAGGARLDRAQEIRAIRCVLAREYADLLIGCQKENWPFHHAAAGKQAFPQSYGEKELRIFEPLLRFAHQVVWIALERKYFDLIEIEICRLFRTEYFNFARRTFSGSNEDVDLPEDEHWILYGPKITVKKKILRNSALPFEILNTDCDYCLLSLGFSDSQSHDERIAFFEKLLITEEKYLVQNSLRIGILGLPRIDFDVMLLRQYSSNNDNQEENNYQLGIPISHESNSSEKMCPLSNSSIKISPIKRKILKMGKRKWLNHKPIFCR